jgi:hypothetical protein
MMTMHERVIEAAARAYQAAIASYLQQVRAGADFCHDVPVKDFFDCVEGSYDYDTEFRIGMTAAVKAADAARAPEIISAVDALIEAVEDHADVTYSGAGLEARKLSRQEKFSARRDLLALLNITESTEDGP